MSKWARLQERRIGSAIFVVHFAMCCTVHYENRSIVALHSFRPKLCSVKCIVQCTLPCPLHRRDKRIFPDTKLLFCSKFPSVLHQWWKYLKHLALSSRVHIDQNNGCSNNLELIEDHTNSLVAVDAVRVVLHQFNPVEPYFQLSPVRGPELSAWRFSAWALYPRQAG